MAEEKPAQATEEEQKPQEEEKTEEKAENGDAKPEKEEAAASAPVETSKTLVLTGHGGYDKLKIEQRPKPKAGTGEVVVSIKAAGMNFSELLTRAGLQDSSPKPPCVLGFEGAGVITEVGEEVQDLKEGDRVIVLSRMGTWAEFVSVKANQCFAMPENMSFEEGAAIPVNYLTARMMLFDIGNLRKGKSVLVHMAAGGVGFAATQLCKTVEDVTVFGTASESKHEAIKENGVTHPIDYRNKDYVQEIKNISASGVDIVLDPLSGEDSTKGFNLLKPMGKIIHFGNANMMSGPNKNYMQMMKTWWGVKSVNPLELSHTNKSVCGFHLGQLKGEESEAMIRETLLDIIKLYSDGVIKPRIDSTWAYEDVGRAMAQLHDRKNIGKVILSIEKEPLPPEEKKEKKKEKESKKKKGKDKKEKKEKEDKIEEKKEEKAEEKEEEKKEEEKPKEEEKEAEKKEEKEGDKPEEAPAAAEGGQVNGDASAEEQTKAEGE